MVAAISIGTAALGAVAANSSANKQAGAAKDAANTQEGQYQQTRADQAPYRAAGYTALGQLAQGSAPGGQFTHQFNASDLNSNLAPNYQFMLSQGQQANQNAAGVAGGLVGGNALQGLQKFTQDYAGNAYQQAYQNYTGNQTNIYNRLANIAGLGQTANQVNATAGANAANNAANYLTSGAAASAAGGVGVANAVNGAANNYIGMNYLNGRSGGASQSPYVSSDLGGGATDWAGNAGASDISFDGLG